MVWVDNYNQVPAGKKVATGVAVGGHSWDVWWVQSSGYLAFNVTSTLTSGNVDLLALFHYAVIGLAWLPAILTFEPARIRHRSLLDGRQRGHALQSTTIP